MVERVAGQGGVVDLDVELVLVGQPVALEEPVHRGGVVVVLVLGGPVRLGPAEAGAGEPERALSLIPIRLCRRSTLW